MAKAEKPKCPKCGSTDISVAADKSNKHYCQKCQNVWVPGLEGLKREDVQLRQLRVENEELKNAINLIRKEKETLAEKALGLQGQVNGAHSLLQIMLDPENRPPQFTVDEAWQNFLDLKMTPTVELTDELAASEDEIFS